MGVPNGARRTGRSAAKFAADVGWALRPATRVPMALSTRSSPVLCYTSLETSPSWRCAMKKFLPFLLLFLGVFAIFGILFLLVRTDALPASVRSLDWRKAIGTALTEPVEEETA
jgi:hypothetical protein